MYTNMATVTCENDSLLRVIHCFRKPEFQTVSENYNNAENKCFSDTTEVQKMTCLLDAVRGHYNSVQAKATEKL